MFLIMIDPVTSRFKIIELPIASVTIKRNSEEITQIVIEKFLHKFLGDLINSGCVFILALARLFIMAGASLNFILGNLAIPTP